MLSFALCATVATMVLAHPIQDGCVGDGAALLQSSKRQVNRALGESKGVCVDGESKYCVGEGMEWTDGKCCVPSDWTCAPGTKGECNKAENTAWTGTRCCAKWTTQCRGEMTKESCAKLPGSSWTGYDCCLPEHTTCGDGTKNACDNKLQESPYAYAKGFTWIGDDQCCNSEQAGMCKEGTEADCQGENMAWIGSHCCVKDANMCQDTGLFFTKGDCLNSWGTFTGSACCFT